MLDIIALRKDCSAVSKALAKRGFVLDEKAFNAMEEARKELQIQTQKSQNERNALSKTIGQAKAKGDDVSGIMEQVTQLKKQLEADSAKLDEVLESQKQFMMGIPNIPHESVPLGKDESDNEELRKWGTTAKKDFKVKDHVSLTEASTQMDFNLASKLSGARFVVLKKDIARLHRALIQFMLNLHTKHHLYEEYYVPLLCIPECLEGTGQLPKFADDQYMVNDDRGAYLIPTAEVPLTNSVRDTVLKEDVLPIRLVAHTPCFRKEAGSYGKDTRGMFRQHQFEKVELVQIVHPDHSYDALEQLTLHAETVLQKLELPYRVVNLCGGDLGFCATKTHDIEVWLPSQEQYREISSCSNTENFQARRMSARFKAGQGKPELVHTLNGSGVAVGRCLIAILENHQCADGSVNIPAALQPFMDGESKIQL